MTVKLRPHQIAQEEAASGDVLAWDGAGWAPTAITADAEAIRDVIGAALTAGVGITITVNDGADTITVAVTQPVLLLANGASVPGGTAVGTLVFEKDA